MDALLTRWAAAIGRPLDQWSGQCHHVACALVEYGLVPGHAVYGYWQGPVVATFQGLRYRGADRPGIRHGWIVQGRRVIDPTRWTLRGAIPSLWRGPGGGWYDRTPDPLPPVPFAQRPALYLADAAMLALLQGVWSWTDAAPRWLSEAQAIEIARVPPDCWGAYAVPLYTALLAAAPAWQAWVPIQHLTAVWPNPTGPVARVAALGSGRGDIPGESARPTPERWPP